MELSKAQKQVIDTKNKSLLVSASAGSGKTFVVIQRIIESIKEGADVSRLLVLTFTNAAASELKERLIKELNNLKDKYLKEGSKTEALRIAKQISRVPMSDISTIHSFCLNIIRNNFYSLGIDPNITTLDATKATIMLNEVICDLIEEEYESSSEEFLDILDILGGEDNLINTIYMLYIAYKNVLNSNEWLEQTIQMYSVKDNVDLIDTKFGKIIIDNIKSRLQVLKIELQNMIEELDSLEDFESRKEMLKVILNSIELALSKQTYDELYNTIPVLLDMPRLPSSKVGDEDLKEQIKTLKQKVSDELKDIANIVYKDSKSIIQELNSSLKYINWYKTIIEKVNDKYMALKKEKCSIDFADYEHLALKALEDENVVEKYKNKYDYIYIDEYQDTSNAQEAIIQTIARENNVIMVGDVKQSIYAFRNAKPELFTNKYEKLKEVDEAQEENQAKIILAQNFRSRKEVLDSSNKIFSSLMTKDFGGANYEDKEALVYGADYDYSLEQSYKTEVNIIEKDVDEDFEQEVDENLTDIQMESILVAKKIQNLVDSKFQVYDIKKKEYRDCKYKDIVILLRTVEGKANIVSDIFAKYNIPCFADTKTGFYKSEEISLVMSFLKILDNPYDDISMVSVMYSIIGKFTLDDLAIIRDKNTSKHIIQILKDLEDKIQDNILKEKINIFLELLERFKLYLKTYNISEVLIKLYNETGLYEALRIEKLGQLKCTNLDNFVQIISDFEKSENIVSLYSLIKYLDVIKNKESAGDSPKLIGENEDVVRIMTIHKSKGLEFPIVILMNTAAKYNERDTKDKLQFEDELGIGIDIYDKEKGVIYPSVIKQAIKAKERRSLRSEALRLLYVAFTRAKEKLIICGTVSSLDKYKILNINNTKETSELIGLSYNSHLQCILPSAMQNESLFDVNVYNLKEFSLDENNDEQLERNISKINKLKTVIKKYDLKPNLEKQQKIKESFLSIDNVENTNKKYTVTELKQSDVLLDSIKPNSLETKITATSYGTFIHSIVEQLDYSKITKQYVIDTIKKVASKLDVKLGNNIDNIAQSILDMVEIMSKYLKNAILIKNELEFVIKDDLQDIKQVDFKEKTLIQGVVDMYIITKNGEHVIVDFKTDRVDNEQELLDRYSLQLNIYKKAIQRAYNIKVDKTYIYSFGLKTLIEVND